MHQSTAEPRIRTGLLDRQVFLVSGWSRNVTGQSLNVDGGMVWD